MSEHRRRSHRRRSAAHGHRPVERIVTVGEVLYRSAIARIHVHPLGIVLLPPRLRTIRLLFSILTCPLPRAAGLVIAISPSLIVVFPESVLVPSSSSVPCAGLGQCVRAGDDAGDVQHPTAGDCERLRALSAMFMENAAVPDALFAVSPSSSKIALPVNA